MSDLADPLLEPATPAGTPGTGADPVDPADEEGFDLWRVYAIFYKWLWLIGTVVAVTFTAVAFWTFRQQRVYRASASVVIDLTPPQVLKGMHEVVDLGSGNFWSSAEYFGTQYRILRSRAVAEKVVARLGLDQDANFLGIDPRLDPDTRAQMAKKIDAAQLLINRIIVTPVKDSRVVTISVEDTNPNRAADLSNAVAEEYIEQNVDRKLTVTHGASIFLAQQLEDARKTLEDAEQKLWQFKEKNDVVSTSMEARENSASQNLVDLNDALTKSEVARLQLEAQQDALHDIIANSKGSEFRAESFTPVLNDPTIQDLRTEYYHLLAEQADLAEQYLPNHPKMQSIARRIQRVRDDIIHASEVVVQSCEYQYRQALDEEKKLRQARDQAKQDALAVNGLEMQNERMVHEKDRDEQIYDLLMKRQKEVQIAGLLRSNNIRLLDSALVPKTPIRPNRAQNLTLALFFGLLLGCGIAVLLDFLDNTIKSQDDVEHGLGLPLLGILPSIPNLAGESDRDNTIQRDLYIAANPKSSITECARGIRTSLLFSSPDRPFKILMVASCGPREGKTTTLISIGITMAQSGQRVLLIDGDLRRPRLHRTFNCSAEHGFSTLILGESTPEQAIKSTGIEGLYVLPAGPVPPNPAEILQSSRCEEVIKELAGRFDRVILDSPPIGVVTDALVMAAQADGLVMVLRVGSTPKKAARRGRRALLDVKAHIYGAVLNDVELGSRAGQYHNYYHYYRYGYYPDARYGDDIDAAEEEQARERDAAKAAAGDS